MSNHLPAALRYHADNVDGAVGALMRHAADILEAGARYDCPQALKARELLRVIRYYRAQQLNAHLAQQALAELEQLTVDYLRTFLPGGVTNE